MLINISNKFKYINLFKNMSRTFFNIILKNLLKSNNQAILLTTSVTMITSNFFYALFTREEKEIIVKKKYKFDRSGFTEFMIIDSNDKHYNLNNSLWYWKWDSIEDWHLIKEEQKLNTLTYGWRVPILGIFPNIVSSQYNKNNNTNINGMIITTSLEEDLLDGKFC
jgi:hypothetical protein